MPTDMVSWREGIRQAVDNIADEELQRRAWFGLGPEVSSPDEEFCQFFDDASAENFFDRKDTGLNDLQMAAGKQLVSLMRDLSNQTSLVIEASELIDDPRWQRIRKAAARFSALLASG